MSANVRFNSGSFTSSAGAAENIHCGFIPEFIIVINANAADGENMLLMDFKDQADGDSLAITQMANDGGSDNTNIKIEGTNGLSERNASGVQTTTDPVVITGGRGFTIPAAFMDTSDVVSWMALGHS